MASLAVELEGWFRGRGNQVQLCGECNGFRSLCGEEENKQNKKQDQWDGER